MAYFVWSDSFSVGNPLIDEQHKKLVKLVDDLFTAMKERKTTEIISKVLNDLAEYTVYHFNTEESLFVRSNYPKIEEHKKIHQEFVAKVKAWISDFNEGRTFISVEMLDFLTSWLINHIKGKDKEMATFVTD